ncbi:hypothetical protein C8J56DRAFT_1166629 [Mycena floridula]|nr:hypothetical protein C8J56DRAFT_1166629 [Mycena floridula]
MYLIVGLRAMYVLIQRGIINSRPRCVLLVTIILMNLAITATFAAEIGVNLNYLSSFSETGYSVRAFQHFSIIGLVASRALLLLNDGIVAWRAWVICDRRWVRIALSCSMVSSLIGIIIACATSIRWVLATGQDYDTTSTLLPMLLPVLGTNLIATVAIGHEAWIYHRTVRKSANKALIQSKAHQILVLLFESGLFYIVMWAIHTAVEFSPSVDLEYAYVNTFVMYILAMYPAVIIILVTQQTSLLETPAQLPLPHSSEVVVSPRSTILNIGFGNKELNESEPKDLSISAV